MLAPVEVSDELQELLARYPLPEGVEDADLNKEELAEALNSSLPTLSRWMSKPGFPIVQQGGQGKSYIFRLSHVFAWRQAERMSEQMRSKQARESIDRLQASFLGLETEDPRSQMTPEMRKKMAEADFAYSRAKHMRKQLVQLEDVQVLLDDLMRTFRDGAESLADRLERELNLSPAALDVVQRAANDTLTAMVARIEREQLEEVDVQTVVPQQQLMI